MPWQHLAKTKCVFGDEEWEKTMENPLNVLKENKYMIHVGNLKVSILCELIVSYDSFEDDSKWRDTKKNKKTKNENTELNPLYKSNSLLIVKVREVFLINSSPELASELGTRTWNLPNFKVGITSSKQKIPLWHETLFISFKCAVIGLYCFWSTYVLS